AFLMLLRYREETGDEIAGFVDAIRARLAKSQDTVTPDLDWPSYAGKARLTPWYLLAALALAASGRKILMHGIAGHTAGRSYTDDALAALDIPKARDVAHAMQMLSDQHFAYLPLEGIHPVLAELIIMKQVLGLRSPINSLVRSVNPFKAPSSLIGVFHPGYIDIHREAALLLNDARTLIFRGDGGEAERRIAKPCELTLVADSQAKVERWPALTSLVPEEIINLNHLREVWLGQTSDDAAEKIVTGTVALALHCMGEAAAREAAHAHALDIWRARR
ncbi:MAG: glycosyl transferase family protein, partial [Alphaproteobacteria bacterium]|nr:glycosyl transferase family protein [Alphaproteobacteria bacterium]